MSDEGIKLYGILIATNAATVVLFQLPMTKLTERLPIIHILIIGTLIYGFGFFLFGLSGASHAALICSMVIWSLGEILIFSNGNLIIDRIAPEDKKGAYFGASGLWALGPTVGPALGGYALDRAGGATFLFLAGVLAMSNAFIYRLGQRAEKRRVQMVEVLCT